MRSTTSINIHIRENEREKSRHFSNVSEEHVLLSRLIYLVRCVVPLRDDFSRIVKISRSRSKYDDLSYSLLNSIVVNVTISMAPRRGASFSDLCQRRKQTEDWDARENRLRLFEGDRGQIRAQAYHV